MMRCCWSCDALMVIKPSAQLPAHFAVSTDNAAAYMGTGAAGNVNSRAPWVTNVPRCQTSSPAHSARMIATASARRALRRALSGQGWPVMASLIASPLPTASQKRPGYICASVAAAWAMTAGGSENSVS